MEAQKYPISVQTFSKIIEGGFTYVDKTAFIARLTANEGCYFLSRPRRFGKSLLLSTLHAYFSGHRELFKGLALDSMDVDWTPIPVLHFDLNSEDYTRPDGLELILDSYLRGYEEEYGRKEGDVSVAQRFRSLIENAYKKTGRKVAVLIDEYDKPLLEIEDNPEIFLRNQAILKSFFGNLKTMDRYIRFAMITGVARFNKVSIFSDLNNLYDISLSEEFAEICGWTEGELLSTFRPGIKRLAEYRGEEVAATIDQLRDYYDGYLFGKSGSRLYNPFSVLIALRDKSIEPYWFDSASPSFLVKRVRSYGISLPDLDSQTCSRRDLMAVGMDTGNPAGLLFQTGYLTIASYDSRRARYTLRIPNTEVKISFAESLYPEYVPKSKTADNPFGFMKFQDDLFAGSPERFMVRLQSLIKALPYELQNEGNYQSIVWLVTTLSGESVTAEHHSYKGRSDLEVFTPDFIYVFEFKYNENARLGLAQINDRDYAGRFALDSREVWLIGANFSSEGETRGLEEWIIEPLQSQMV